MSNNNITMNNNATTLNAYGFVTPTHTKKSTTRPDCYTKSQWEHATFDGFMDFVHVLEKKLTTEEFLVKNTPLFNTCGMPSDLDHWNLLLMALAKDATVDHEEAHKVNPISYFRKFFNGEWEKREARPVVYKAPTAPKPATPKAPKTSSKNGPTKAELAAQNAELLKQLAEIKALMGIAA
jgi:hypothetical protein